MIDFSDLSIYSESRRKQLFSLSLASKNIVNLIFFVIQFISFKKIDGQPVNWNKACNEALSAIFGFMEVFNFDDLIHGGGKIMERISANKPYSRMVTSPMRDTSRAMFSPVNSPLRVAKSVYEESSCQIKSPSRESHKNTNSPAQAFLLIQQVFFNFYGNF
jgi:hypothetical protein